MIKAVLDDITLVTALLCDDRVEIDECQAENHPQKKAIAAHCSWTLKADMEDAEWKALVTHIKARSAESQWTYYCEICGADWLRHGPCGHVCAAKGPPLYLFDSRKALVIKALREARQELANERGEGTLYANNKRT